MRRLPASCVFFFLLSFFVIIVICLVVSSYFLAFNRARWVVVVPVAISHIRLFFSASFPCMRYNLCNVLPFDRLLWFTPTKINLLNPMPFGTVLKRGRAPSAPMIVRTSLIHSSPCAVSVQTHWLLAPEWQLPTRFATTTTDAHHTVTAVTVVTTLQRLQGRPVKTTILAKRHYTAEAIRDIVPPEHTETCYPQRNSSQATSIRCTPSQ